MIENLLEITLFGYPRARLGAKVIDSFITKRAEALLYYLVVTGRSHSRDKLATLFWPDMSEAKGKKNLRTALPVLRKHVGEYLLISREAIAFDKEQPYFLDTETLQTAVSHYTSRDDIGVLATAVAGYRGEFMEGFHISGAPEFDDWLLVQSEHLHNLFLQGLHILAEHYLQEHQYKNGLAVTERLLKAEPWSEIAYRQRMLLFAYQQQRSAALKTYEQCQQVLKDAFAIKPMIATTALYERIRAEETNQHELVNPLHNLPRELTSFVGRENELRQIRTKLLDSRYPLVTIIGEGGIGKSRTALTAVRQLLYDFSDGCWFVSLVGIEASDDEQQIETTLALAISQALQITLQANEPVGEQVINYLRPKKLLLMLDNMEHLINGVEFIIQIMKQAKQVQLLVTSRRRLNLQAEHLFRLTGLPVPEVVNDVEQAMHYASVQLFVERITQVKPEQKLTLPVIKAISRICHMVDGLPLGIELAGALVEHQSCEAIATYLETNVGELSTEMRDLEPHHRSVWALFDRSWQLLAEPEQHVLAQCAVFAGGFTWEAAMAIVQATEMNLTSLVHQSLLVRAENGRYNMHPLIQQFARQKLNQFTLPNCQLETVNQHHAQYYLQTCYVDYADMWRTPLHLLQAESNNKRLAWQNAIQLCRFELLAEVAINWMLYWNRLTLFEEGLRTIQEALQAVENSELPFIVRVNWIATLQIALGEMLSTTGKFQEAYNLTEHALHITEEPYLLGCAYRIQSNVMLIMGHLDKSNEFFEKMMLFKEFFTPIEQVISLTNGATLRGSQGNLVESKQQLEEALNIATQHGYDKERSDLLNNLSVFYQHGGEYDKARHHYQQSYDLAHSLDYIWGQKRTGINLIQNLFQLGLYGEATEVLNTIFTTMSAREDKRGYTLALACQTSLYNYLKRFDDAIECGRLVLDRLSDETSLFLLLLGYRALGDAWLSKGEWEQAEAVYGGFVTHCQSIFRLDATMEPLSGLVYAAYLQKDKVKISSLIEQIFITLSEVPVSYGLLYNLTVVHWRCYVALDYLEDERAPQILQKAYETLQEQAEMIEDIGIRTQFLQNVLVNREIIKRVEG